MDWSESGKPLTPAPRIDGIDAEQALVLKRAVEHYGRRAQLKKCAEELIELAVECVRAANAGALGEAEWSALSEIVDEKVVGSMVRSEEMADALADERADVTVVLYEFDNLLLPSLRPAVRAKVASKIERLAGRMEG